jgi:hypothetical protein
MNLGDEAWKLRLLDVVGGDIGRDDVSGEFDVVPGVFCHFSVFQDQIVREWLCSENGCLSTDTRDLVELRGHDEVVLVQAFDLLRL